MHLPHLVLLATVLVGCGLQTPEEGDSQDRSLSVNELHLRANKAWEADHRDHYWSYLWLDKVCETETYPEDGDEWCIRSVFFPQFDRCYDDWDATACEQATREHCYMCDLFRPHLIETAERLRSQG